MDKLNIQISSLLAEQKKSWELARDNYAGLKTVRTKSFSFGDFEVKVQFNPIPILEFATKIQTSSFERIP